MNQIRVLIVDDERQIVETLTNIIEGEGYRVLAAYQPWRPWFFLAIAYRYFANGRSDARQKRV